MGAHDRAGAETIFQQQAALEQPDLTIGRHLGTRAAVGSPKRSEITSDQQAAQALAPVGRRSRDRARVDGVVGIGADIVDQPDQVAKHATAELGDLRCHGLKIGATMREDDLNQAVVM